ncbi:FHA domain-containing protein [Cellulomonas telluris]|uniref:FHA domain-containing protein n=1 Tax=Cellulomonas telluris TaxID=2306636 RepID=UPI0010A9234A|nr:FHA domain-containing protein [Cellulomonas telluris]
MNDATRAHEYVEGEWTAVAADGLLALVAPAARPEVAGGLWDVGLAGGDVLSALGVLAAAGFAELPQFAIVTTPGDGALRAVLRGPVELRVRTGDGEQVLAAREDAVWTEHRAEGVLELELRVAGAVADAPAWPLVAGVVRAAVLRRTAGAGRTERSTVASGAAREPGTGEGDAEEPSGAASGGAAHVVVGAGPAAVEDVTFWPGPGSTPAAPDGTGGQEPTADEQASVRSRTTAAPAVPAAPVPPAPTSLPLDGPAPAGGSSEHAPADRLADPLGAPLAGSPDEHDDVQDTVLQDGWWQSAPAPEVIGAPPTGAAPVAGAAATATTTGHPWGPPAPPAGAPVEVSDDDHDGMTILSSDLARLRDRLPAWTHDAVPGPFPAPEPAPLPARIVLSTGLVVDLDRAVLLGRAPQVSRVTNRELPRLVTVPSPNQDISRTHAEVRLEGDHVVVTDLDSTNGVHVSRPGEGVRRLQAGEPSVVGTDEVVDLGDGVTFTVERSA